MSKFQEILPIPRDEAENILQQGPPAEIALALVRLAYHDPDWKWVQDTCVRLSFHPDKFVRRTCATCFGHIARIHGRIEKQTVMPVLDRLLQDSDVKGEAEDALEDLSVFIK